MKNFCPHCKSQDIGMRHRYYGNQKHEYTMECYHCNYTTQKSPTYDGAVTEWEEEFERRRA